MATKKRAKKQDSPSAGAEKRKKTEQVKTWAQILVDTETHKYQRRESGVSP
jgi:hypothetical protein